MDVRKKLGGSPPMLGAKDSDVADPRIAGS